MTYLVLRNFLLFGNPLFSSCSFLHMTFFSLLLLCSLATWFQVYIFLALLIRSHAHGSRGDVMSRGIYMCVSVWSLCLSYSIFMYLIYVGFYCHLLYLHILTTIKVILWFHFVSFFSLSRKRLLKIELDQVQYLAHLKVHLCTEFGTNRWICVDLYKEHRYKQTNKLRLTFRVIKIYVIIGQHWYFSDLNLPRSGIPCKIFSSLGALIT